MQEIEKKSDPEPQSPQSADDFDWVKAEVEKLYRASTDIPIERWDRVRWEIDFYDLTLQLLEETGNMKGKPSNNKISCPFHGRDSTPSFTFYRGSNSAFCFGCEPPAVNQFYDNVRLVSSVFGISKRDSLKWLEKRYKLPAMTVTSDIVDLPDTEEEEVVELNFDDLREPFLALATVLSKDTETQELLDIFFKAQQTQDPLPLAKVLGKDRVKRILRHKAHGTN